MDKKFKFYCKELGMTEAFSINELKTSVIRNAEAYDKTLQYLGYKDANARELYEGDVIELTITDELMDIHKNSFIGSNLGKYIQKSIEENNPITSVICAIEHENNCLTTGYKIYCLRKGKIQRYGNDGALDVDTSSYNDGYFPSYLAKKGAVWIGNILENPELPYERSELWYVPKKKFYVSVGSVDDMEQLVDAIGIDRIKMPYDSPEETYHKGYVQCLIDLDNNTFEMISWMNVDTNYPLYNFENFMYSNVYNHFLESKENIELERYI